MKTEDCFNLGKITRVFGTKGELLLVLDVDDPNDYANLDFFYADFDGELIPFFIEKLTIKNGTAVAIKLTDINDPQAAQPLVNKPVYLPLDRLPQLDEDQFYYHEIIGYKVIDDTLGETGIVREVLELPMQDVLKVEYQEKEILLPVSDELIIKVDRKKKLLFISAPIGLIELYME
ncbi:MAG: ribosome maturation factor RimM [Bacteroidota bacterium]|nr:ribosome maturation factor RimM [Bacteroidota bacterium]